MTTNAQIIPDSKTLNLTALASNVFTFNPKVPITGANFDLTAFVTTATLTLVTASGLKSYTYHPTVTVSGQGPTGCTMTLTAANLITALGNLKGGAYSFQGHLVLADVSGNTAVAWEGLAIINKTSIELSSYVADNVIVPDGQTLSISSLADNYFTFNPKVGAALSNFDCTTYNSTSVMALTAVNGLTPWATYAPPTITVSGQGPTGCNVAIKGADVATAFAGLPGGATNFTGTLTLGTTGGVKAIVWSGAFQLEISNQELAQY